MTKTRYYYRQIILWNWYSFCLRFVRRCRMFRKIIDDTNIEINYCFIKLEKINYELEGIKKRNNKIRKFLGIDKSDCT